MAHEKLKKQYEKDRRNYEQPWELWQFQDPKKPKCMGDIWDQCVFEPAWNKNYKYRRIEPVFEPEYFSALNWREAEKLVGKEVEFSQDGTVWTDCGKLLEIFKHERRTCRYRREGYLDYFIYIRTTPKTHAHPTITIGDKELPRPEVEAPGEDTKYWLFCQSDVFKMTWCGNGFERCWLKKGMIHLTESRAQTWASWWDETVVKAVQK